MGEAWDQAVARAAAEFARNRCFENERPTDDE
jgi:hypothetical protein